MNSFIKLGSMFSVLGAIMLSTSGCSCSMKKEKVDEETLALSESSFFHVDNKESDFTVTLNEVIQANDGTTTKIYKVSRDVATQTYNLSLDTTIEKIDAEKLIEKITHTIYKNNEGVYVKTIKNSDEKTEKVSKVSYESPLIAFQNTRLLAEEGILTANYYELFKNNYDVFKYIPYNGCATEGNETNLPNILESSIVYDQKTSKAKDICKPTRQLFSQNYTYKIHYRVSISEIVDYDITMNKNDKLSRVVKNSKVASGTAGIITTNQEFIYDYSDVKVK